RESPPRPMVPAVRKRRRLTAAARGDWSGFIRAFLLGCLSVHASAGGINGSLCEEGVKWNGTRGRARWHWFGGGSRIRRVDDREGRGFDAGLAATMSSMDRPVLVLGGGINGASVARDLVLNGVPVWL